MILFKGVFCFIPEEAARGTWSSISPQQLRGAPVHRRGVGGGRTPPVSPKALCEEGLGAGQEGTGVPVPSLSPPLASHRFVPIPDRMKSREGEEMPARPCCHHPDKSP